MAGVLYIEHERIPLCEIANALTAADHKVFVAYDPYTAQRATKNHGPQIDLVIMDVLFKHGLPEDVDCMPNDVIRAFETGDSKWRPIIALSARTEHYREREKLRSTNPNVILSVDKVMTQIPRLLRVIDFVNVWVHTPGNELPSEPQMQTLMGAVDAIP